MTNLILLYRVLIVVQKEETKFKAGLHEVIFAATSDTEPCYVKV